MCNKLTLAQIDQFVNVKNRSPCTHIRTSAYFFEHWAIARHFLWFSTGSITSCYTDKRTDFSWFSVWLTLQYNHLSKDRWQGILPAVFVHIKIWAPEEAQKERGTKQFFVYLSVPWQRNSDNKPACRQQSSSLSESYRFSEWCLRLSGSVLPSLDCRTKAERSKHDRMSPFWLKHGVFCSGQDIWRSSLRPEHRTHFSGVQNNKYQIVWWFGLQTELKHFYVVL